MRLLALILTALLSPASLPACTEQAVTCCGTGAAFGPAVHAPQTVETSSASGDTNGCCDSGVCTCGDPLLPCREASSEEETCLCGCGGPHGSALPAPFTAPGGGPDLGKHLARHVVPFAACQEPAETGALLLACGPQLSAGAGPLYLVHRNLRR